jgi:cytochrome P450
MAGSDTTAVALLSILFHIIRNEVVRNRVYEEIDQFLPSHERVSYSAAANLHYLNSCCKEGMRMAPSVAMPLPRETPANGCTILGTYLPAGVRLGINPAVSHYDPKTFGLADRYQPERWLQESPESEKLFLFGRGKRACPGKNVSS